MNRTTAPPHLIPPVPVALKDRQRWDYRGEGGANLVLSLASNDRQRRQIVRFAKTKFVGKDQEATIVETAYFANEIMRPLLGVEFVRPLRIGVVSDEDFELVKSGVEPLRPASRVKKRINTRKVILSPDCAFLSDGDYGFNTRGDTFSVEIKPKQGWHSLKANCSVDLCHRCLKQYAKLYSGEIDCISRYCPLDLFSGDESRMKRAIFDLYENPSNKFKLFKNGELIYTENVGSLAEAEQEISSFLGDRLESAPLDALSAMLSAALLAPVAGGAKNSRRCFDVSQDFIDLKLEKREEGRRRECDISGTALPANCVLQRLLKLQNYGGGISDHEAKLLCDRLLETKTNVGDLEGLHRLVLWWHPNNPKLEHQLGPDEIDALIRLQRFLLSVTAKDVSLLLTFREISDREAEAERNLPSLHLNGGKKRFRVMISVIDLDPKSVHRISSWVQRKEEWLKIYFSSVNRNDQHTKDS